MNTSAAYCLERFIFEIIINVIIRAISHWHKYSLQLLAEEVISLVLPLSIHTDASAGITRASIHRHSRFIVHSS